MFKTATASQVLDRKNWSMVVCRIESPRTGKVTYEHTVIFMGQVYDTRKSTRAYQAYKLNIEVGKLVEHLRQAANYSRAQAARYRRDRNSGEFDAGLYDKWAAHSDELAKEYDQQAAQLEAKGPEYNWQLLGRGTGYVGNAAKARGTIVVKA